MDLKAVFTSPWVISGGIALGAILLLSKGSAAPSSNFSSAFTAANAAASSQFAASTSARVALGEAAYANNATVAGYYAGVVNTAMQVGGQVNIAAIQSNNGVLNNLAYVNASVANEAITNNARITATGIQTAGQVQISKQQTDASQQIAKTTANASIINSLLGALGNGAKAAATLAAA